MKKIYVIISIFVSLLVFSSCSNKEIDYKQVMISVYLEGTDNNKGIEIYNASEDEISLNDFSLVVYKNATSQIKEQIHLKGKLKSKDCYVVCNSEADQDLLKKADLKSDDLLYTGTEAVALLYNKVVCDVIGVIGDVNDLKDVTLVRKVDRINNEKEFNPYDYIIYGLNNFNYFGDFINSVTPEELLNGPQFQSDCIDVNFFENNNDDVMIGTGNIVEVSFKSVLESSSAYFNFPAEYNLNSAVGPSNIIHDNTNIYVKVEFARVSPPKAATVTFEQWGIPAKNYVIDTITNASKYYVQSITNEELLNKNKRVSAYLWVMKEDSYSLINYELIKQGFSKLTIEDNFDMCYKDIPYTSYFKNAQLYAMENKLALYGQKDPTWDYLLDKPKE